MMVASRDTINDMTDSVPMIAFSVRFGAHANGLPRLMTGNAFSTSCSIALSISFSPCFSKSVIVVSFVLVFVSSGNISVVEVVLSFPMGESGGMWLCSLMASCVGEVIVYLAILMERKAERFQGYRDKLKDHRPSGGMG
jgi:hypothetical protein